LSFTDSSLAVAMSCAPTRSKVSLAVLFGPMHNADCRCSVSKTPLASPNLLSEQALLLWGIIRAPSVESASCTGSAHACSDSLDLAMLRGVLRLLPRNGLHSLIVPSKRVGVMYLYANQVFMADWNRCMGRLDIRKIRKLAAPERYSELYHHWRKA